MSSIGQTDLAGLFGTPAFLGGVRPLPIRSRASLTQGPGLGRDVVYVGTWVPRSRDENCRMLSLYSVPFLHCRIISYL